MSRLWVSEAERKTLTSSKRSRISSARSSPRSFGIRTEKATPSRRWTAASTSAASASCGITSGRTNEVTSIRLNPVAESRSISRTLSAVAIVSGSFWKPSRGPTSRMRTLLGSSVMRRSLCGRLASTGLGGALEQPRDGRTSTARTWSGS